MASDFKKGAALGLIMGWFVVNFVAGITGSFTPWLVLGVAAYLFIKK